MLTQSHYAAQKFVRCQDKSTYRQYMCGLCHALGDGYGLPYRLLTNHDTILLNLLTAAQVPGTPKVVMRRCPLNPMRFVSTNRDAGSRFAAAVTVVLAAVNVDDDIADSGGHSRIARLARAMLNQPEQTAFRALRGLGFDLKPLEDLSLNQAAAEASPALNPAAPSAVVGAALFKMTASLAGTPDNAAALALMGGHYGTHIYLADAERDLADDIQQQAFNPLRPFVEMIDGVATLSGAGQVWLHDQQSVALAGIQSALGRLDLRRHQAAVAHLLTRPLEQSLGLEPTAASGACIVQQSGKKRRKHKDDTCSICCIDCGCICCCETCGDECDCGCCRCDDGCCGCD